MSNYYHHDLNDVSSGVTTQLDTDEQLQFLTYSKNIVCKAVKHPTKTNLTESVATDNDSIPDDRYFSSSVFTETKETEIFSPQFHQRKQFFNTIRKCYQLDSLSENISDEKKSALRDVTSANEIVSDIEASHIASTLRSRKRRLHQLRKLDPTKMEIGIRIQWILLELYEMREQDKMLYLQLMKLQAAMKEVCNDLKIFEENLDEDFIFGPICHWPRSTSSSDALNFSSSDGANEFKPSRRGLKRDLSFQYHSSSARPRFKNNLSKLELTD